MLPRGSLKSALPSSVMGKYLDLPPKSKILKQ